MVTAPSFQACVQEAQHSNTGDSFQEQIAAFFVSVSFGLYRGCLGEFLHGNGEIIIALFTIIVGIATWFLWRSTRNLVRSAERTAERQLRAYVFVVHAAMKRKVVEPDMSFTVTVKNTGQTPAYDMRLWGHAGLNEDALKKQPDFADVEAMPLGSGEGIAADITFDPPLSDAEVEQIHGTPSLVYVLGEVRYVDAFGHKRWTRYRMTMSIATLQTGELAYCKDGNEAN